MKTALIVVDMQNDFISGSLAVPHAYDIVGLIQDRMVRMPLVNDLVVLTADAHPKDHISFKEFGGQWPAHCVRSTWVAQLQAGIGALVDDYGFPIFMKGRQRLVEEYSGFANVGLHRHLQNEEVRRVEICGLARNVCVEATAKAAREHGYVVDVLENLCRSV